KLGGNMAGVITYTVLINLVVAVVIPLFIPFIHPVEGFTFGQTFNFVLVQVFPLLILPCICAWMLRYLAPKVHAKICEFTWISFYLWAFSLALAVLMCTRIIVRSSAPWTLIMEIAAAALACCIFNFWAGRRLGRAYKCKTSAGQALGQKNTVFLIWTGYSFMDPVTSVAGGFYSIWQNCFNSWQLYRRRKYLEAVNGVTDNSVD
ncbi:MAG: transporter, partial [Bacteroidales bacterium]|nr:transporter [Bacteroidales bacterium]